MSWVIDLEGQTAVVSGASRGIGRAIAAVCAGVGCHVLLVGRDKDALAATAGELAGGGGVGG
jgi:3-oxoacyl-[acyl-carrier protein] reductase